MSRTSAMGLKVRPGDQIPSIGLRASDGYLLNLRTFVTKQPVALAFFGAPTMKGAARRTGHKLIEALAEGYDRLREAGIAVVGISCDNERQQQEYIAERSLPFLLFSDERRSAVGILGIPTVNDGENYNVASPAVLVVDTDGVVRSVIDKPAPEAVIDLIVRAVSEPLPTRGEAGAAPVERAPSGGPRTSEGAPPSGGRGDLAGTQPAPSGTGSADPSAPPRAADAPDSDPHSEPPPTQAGPSPTDPQVPQR